MQRPRINTQSGSVFFIILFAIAMFAALSYAVMDGSRNSAATLSDDQARLAAQELIAFGDSVAKAVQTMRLRGVTETQFDFSNPVYKLINGSARIAANSSCTSSECKVFDIAGGRVTATPAPKSATVDQGGWSSVLTVSGHALFRVLQVANVGTTAPELMLLFPYINKSVCMKINDVLGITNPSGDAPVDTEGTYVDYSGNIATFPNPAGFGLGDQSTAIVGKTSFCTYNTSTSAYYFWTVILTR